MRLLMISVLFCLGAGEVSAANKLLDYIDVRQSNERNEIVIFFQVPVRVLTHLINREKSEISIRVRPVITPGTEADFLGEDETLSWRASAELPLDRVVFNGRSLAESSVLISFSAPIAEYAVEETKDFSSIRVILPKLRAVEEVEVPDTGAILGVPRTELGAESGRGEAPTPARAGEPLAGAYVINLLSQTGEIDLNKVAAIPLAEGQRLYTTQTRIKGKVWYRLRVGFFDSQEAAGRARKKISRFYPDSWIDRASNEERSTVAQERPVDISVSAVPKTPALPRVEVPALPKAESERQRLMMNKAREVMTAADYPTAIRLLTAILEDERSPYRKEALELLGLARERNGQLAHANAEYERYLELYPEGEDADRVRQRLAGLLSRAQRPRKKLRPPKRQEIETEPEWEIFGSLAQAYRRDWVDSEQADGDSVIRSEIGTNLDVSARRRSSESDIRIEFNGGYDWNLLNNGDEDVKTISDAYFDYRSRKSGYLGRIGRQRLRSSGIQSRFDGAVIGYRINDDNVIRVYSGLPVESSSDIFFNSDKYFFGASSEMTSVINDLDVTVFGIEQRAGGFVDRRAVGAEVRYFDETKSFFGLVDYDFYYGVLNTVLLQSNWTLPTQTRLYANFDYRTSPFLNTTNALQGQSVGTLDDLRDSFTRDEVEDLARDRTARSRLFSIGGSHPLTPTFLVSGDITVSNVSGTPTSGGVEGSESTGNEFFYTLQVIKNDLFKSGDIGILETRYADSKTTDTYSITANSRYPISSVWRINPRLGVTYRENKNNADTRLGLTAFLRTEYRMRNDLLLEMELGANWTSDRLSTGTERFVDYFFLGGYRWTF